MSLVVAAGIPAVAAVNDYRGIPDNGRSLPGSDPDDRDHILVAVTLAELSYEKTQAPIVNDLWNGLIESPTPSLIPDFF